jgi:hypothetical protein
MSWEWTGLADIAQLRQFARTRGFGVTGPLAQVEVEVLAREWMPEMRFHENENFHCISYGTFLRLRNEQVRSSDWLEALNPSDPRLTIHVSPPVFFESQDRKVPVQPGDAAVTTESYISNVREVTRPTSVYDTRDRSPHGLALQYFGSDRKSGAVKLPRFQPITAIAEYRYFREALLFRAMAELDGRAGRLPTDAEGRLLDAAQIDLPFDKKLETKHLTRLIEAIRAADRADRGIEGAAASEEANLSELIADDILTRTQWRVLRDFALLEYFFVYGYNDVSVHHDNPLFVGDHEGDVEGFGVLFDRADVDGILQASDRTDFLRNQLAPRFFVTSAHSPWQQLDQAKDLASLSRAEIKSLLHVYVMPGSHASYLDAGEYDNLEPYDELIEAGAATAAALSSSYYYAVPAALIALLIAHLLLPEEETSDKGAHTLPPGAAPTPNDPTRVPSRVLVTPLSRNRNIYQDAWRPGSPSEIDIPLEERAFPGQWGVDGSRTISKMKRFVDKVAELLG